MRDCPNFPVARATANGPAPTISRTLFNHISTEWKFTQKDQLSINLRAYEAFLASLPDRGEFTKMQIPFHPQTFRLEDWSECERFVQQLQVQSEDISKNIWIIKPTASSGGEGITVHQDTQLFLSDFESCKSKPDRGVQMQGPNRFCMTEKIAQRYIARPLLIHGRKFDVRSYFYIADVNDELVFYCDGYIRINAELYDTSLSDLSNSFKHLSNISIQKNHPQFKELADSMRLKFPQFQEYLTQHNLAPPNWVEDTFKPQLRLMMWFAFQSCKHALKAPTGVFSMVGADFIIDETLNIFLIEFSKSPAVYRSQVDVCPFSDRFRDMIAEIVNIQTEIYERKKSGETFSPGQIFHLSSIQTFEPCRPPNVTIPSFIPSR